jgi:hypothetical protein
MKKITVRIEQIAKLSRNKSGKLTVVLMSQSTPSIIKAKLAMPIKELEFQNHSVNMQQAMVDDTRGFFSPPFSPVFNRLAQWKTENIEYLDSINDVKNNVIGGKGRKKTAKLALRITLDFVLAYVNGIMLLNQDKAQEIAENALCGIVGGGSSNKQEIEVKALDEAGAISVKTLAPKYPTGGQMPATYYREYSSDKGVTWIPMIINNRANDVAHGLDSGVSYIFRKRYWTAKGGLTKWVVSSAVTPN